MFGLLTVQHVSLGELQANVSDREGAPAWPEADQLVHRVHGHRTGGRQAVPVHLPQVRPGIWKVNGESIYILPHGVAGMRL